jgi:uncharacterized membrane protein YidH (DUF202 family)
MADLNDPENNPVDSRTEWAALRTRLAEERTLNAWLRTGWALKRPSTYFEDDKRFR